MQTRSYATGLRPTDGPNETTTSRLARTYPELDRRAVHALADEMHMPRTAIAVRVDDALGLGPVVQVREPAWADSSPEGMACRAAMALGSDTSLAALLGYVGWVPHDGTCLADDIVRIHREACVTVAMRRCGCCGDDAVMSGPLCGPCGDAGCELGTDAAGDLAWWACERDLGHGPLASDPCYRCGCESSGHGWLGCEADGCGCLLTSDLLLASGE